MGTPGTPVLDRGSRVDPGLTHRAGGLSCLHEAVFSKYTTQLFVDE